MSTTQSTPSAAAAHRDASIASAPAGTTAPPQMQGLWRATRQQCLQATTRIVAVNAPTGAVDATAHLLPRVGGQHTEQSVSFVRIHDRNNRSDSLLYRATEATPGAGS